MSNPSSEPDNLDPWLLFSPAGVVHQTECDLRAADEQAQSFVRSLQGSFQGGESGALEDTEALESRNWVNCTRPFQGLPGVPGDDEGWVDPGWVQGREPVFGTRIPPSSCAPTSISEAAWYDACRDLETDDFLSATLRVANHSFQESDDASLLVPLPDDRILGDFQRAAVEATSQQRFESRPRFSWETSSSLRFSWERGTSPLQVIGAVDFLDPEESDDEAKRRCVPPTTVKFLKRITVERSEEDIRTAALKKMRLVILWDPEVSSLGRSLLSLLGADVNEEAIKKSFSDAFRTKASRTISKRGGSLLRYFSWCTTESIDSPLAVDEPTIYMYANFLRDSGARPTSMTHFVEGLRFVHGVAKLLHMEPETVLSSRVLGISRDLYLMKRPLQQKPELTVPMLMALEAFCVETGPVLACICGQLLFCAHSADRWSDSQSLKEISIQESDGVILVVASGLTSKTTVSKEAKTRLLPYAALGCGLSGNNWAKAWLEAREHEGLSLENFALPSRLESQNRWSSVQMGSVEATSYLQDFLILKGIDQDQAMQRATHSLKATLTSWAGRCPRPKFSGAEKRLLGHHIAPKEKSPATYARQQYTLLYGRVMAMFEAIRAGDYDPDLSDVDRVVQVAAAERPGAAQDVIAPEPEAPVPRHDFDEFEDPPSSQSSEASEAPGRGGGGLERAPFGPNVSEDSLVVHTVSGITHCLKDQANLWCGRPLSRNHIPFREAGVYFEDPDPCKQCRHILEAAE